MSSLVLIDYEALSHGDYLFETREEYIERMTPFLTVTWVIVAAYLFYLKDGIFWFVRELFKLPGALLGIKPKRKKQQKSNVEKH